MTTERAAFRADLFEADDTCPLCLELLDTSSVLVLHPCRHYVHAKCSRVGKLTLCPLCRAVITTDNDYCYSEASGGSDSGPSQSSSLFGHGDIIEDDNVVTTVVGSQTISSRRDTDGTRRWYKNGQLHRDDDLPAWVWADGSKQWWKNGQLHRDGDLPAYEGADGSKYWYKNGQLHRDGDLPAWVWADGSKSWYKNGQRHRNGDLPAIEWANGTKVWYKNGVLQSSSKSSSCSIL
jgi:Ring finger domain